MQKRANPARAGRLRRHLAGWIIGLTFAWMAAAGLTGALDLKCGGKLVAQVTGDAEQKGRKRSSAEVSACRTGGVNEQDPKDT